jgi:hypothetical protein
LLNDNFISIKIDREERPDIDHLLQIAFQIMNGRGGGWPLSIFLTPDKKPFFAGTYFPFQSKWGVPGFPDVLKAIIEAFKTKNSEIVAQSIKLEKYLKKLDENHVNNLVSEIPIENIFHSVDELMDNQNGGFGQAPKFPNETTLLLLLHESARSNNRLILDFIFKTIDKMINGGIFDQIGGGIHRYSVDENWLVPHFEKMLYNQSLFVLVLLEAYRINKNLTYLEKAHEILEYVSREMKTIEGGFYSSQNADSEGVEGKFFVWEKDELKFLDEESINLFCDYYDVTVKGNWEEKNILHVNTTLEELSKKYNKNETEIKALLNNAKTHLLQIRNKRIKPSTDVKLITSWNALMIKAFILAYRVFESEEHKINYYNIAKQGIKFLSSQIENSTNLIFRIFINEKRSIPGFLDDFQYSISAFLDFFEISLEQEYLTLSRKLFKFSIENFRDNDNSGYYYSLDQHNTIISKFKDNFDSPLPSAISYLVQNSLRLGFFESTNFDYYRDIAMKAIKNSRIETQNLNVISQSSQIYSWQLLTNSFTEITLTYKLNNFQLHNFINKLWLPFRLQIDFNIGKTDPKIQEIDFLKGKAELDSQFSVFICKNFVCSKPLTNENQIKEYLKFVYPKLTFE